MYLLYIHRRSPCTTSATRPLLIWTGEVCSMMPGVWLCPVLMTTRHVPKSEVSVSVIERWVIEWWVIEPWT